MNAQANLSVLQHIFKAKLSTINRSKIALFITKIQVSNILLGFTIIVADIAIKTLFF